MRKRLALAELYKFVSLFVTQNDLAQLGPVQAGWLHGAALGPVQAWTLHGASLGPEQAWNFHGAALW